MFVPAGSLTEGGDALRVAHHIWVGSKAVWDEIGDAGKHTRTSFVVSVADLRNAQNLTSNPACTRRGMPGINPRLMSAT